MKTQHTTQIPLFATSPNDPTQEVPYGYCHCGCGQLTQIATRNNRKFGWIKGQPLFFVHGHNRRAPVDVRFWRYVTQGKPDECWEWQGATRWGYGALNGCGAHRVSWEIHNGPIPESMEVCHSCDNPPCCNPAHLFLGTRLDNVRDMDAKGRRKTVCNPRKGELRPEAKLTSGDIIQIRELAKDGLSQRKIGLRFGISQQTISDIVRYKMWKHVP